MKSKNRLEAENAALLSFPKYDARTHLSLNKDAPASRAIQAGGRIVADPQLGGLHHQYGQI
jgi:hypothetical protein